MVELAIRAGVSKSERIACFNELKRAINSRITALRLFYHIHREFATRCKNRGFICSAVQIRTAAAGTAAGGKNGALSPFLVIAGRGGGREPITHPR